MLWAAASCTHDRPWDAPPDGGTDDPSRPFLPPKPDASWLGDAGVADGGDDHDAGAALPSPVGGLWVSCYGGFRPSGHPVRDVTRLGLLCGPPNGMRLHNEEPFRGEVAAGAPPSSHEFEVAQGECYRLFVVADLGVTDLDVLVESSRGSRLARDHGEDRWPVIHPERPFCTFDDDTFTIRLRANRGAGSYAAQVWKLPSRT